MFTALLNRNHPNLFVSRSGEFTLVNLYSDGTTHPNTRSYPTADMKPIGWPGMFGVESPPISEYNTTHVMKNSSFLINDGPWHDIVNRYTFKDNRPFGSVPHRIKIFQDGKWKALAGLLPHRRKKERDSRNYEQEAAKLSSELHFDSFGNSLETGVPFYDKYKFIRYSRAEQGHIIADETSCGYDHLICYWRRRIKWIITIATSGSVGAILLFGPLIYLFFRWRKFNTEINAMRWRLKDSEVTFRYQYTDEQSADSDACSSSSESSDESITNIEAIDGLIMPTLTIRKGSDHVPNRLGIDYNRRKSNFSGVRDRRTMPTASAAGNCRRKSYFVKNDPPGSFLKLTKNNEGSTLSVESEEDTRDYIYTDLAVYNDHEWAAKELSRAATYIIKGSGRNFRIEMKELLELKHKNLAKLCGVVYNNNLANYMFLSQYCKRGSLKNVLEDKDFIFDLEIKLSFICDMIHGMEYLHNHTSIGSHGYLKSSNVVVTGCLTAKIADFGTLCRVTDTEKLEELGETSANIHSMWSAPEILREQIQQSVFGTKEGDVYSFGIICHEILEYSGPFNTHDHHGLDAQEVVTLVRKCHSKSPYRPAYSVNPNMETKERTAVNMSLQCWSEDPEERPSFKGLLRGRVPDITSIRKSVVEHALETVKKYSKKKEKKISQLDSELRSIRGDIGRLRLQILPWEVAENIEEGIYPGVESLLSSSIMCIEITGGLELLESGVSSRDVWAALQAIRDEIYSFINYYPGLFCTLATESLYVIIANGDNQYRDNVTVILRQLYKELVIFVKKLGLPRGRLRVRAGMDSGCVDTGVVGDQVLSYQIFGPVYTIADMMRSNADPGKLLVSENSKKLLKSDNFKETGAYKYRHSVYYQPGQNLIAS
ncbi:receptor-type guanylate cyclase gcy-28-like [Bolinopsis microptera]|uniref:receptor-type guanylate cyclase gcy-28-like n=1 Tax=Bolinopsis microptera TaxID=2820187 RepID=UPI0030799D58